MDKKEIDNHINEIRVCLEAADDRLEASQEHVAELLEMIDAGLAPESLREPLEEIWEHTTRALSAEDDAWHVWHDDIPLEIEEA